MDRCSTCGGQYRKPSYDDHNYCSNGFHCCRDCVWLQGRITKRCPECTALEARWAKEWEEWAKKWKG
jgi:hypothetical protein